MNFLKNLCIAIKLRESKPCQNRANENPLPVGKYEQGIATLPFFLLFYGIRSLKRRAVPSAVRTSTTATCMERPVVRITFSLLRIT